MFFLMCSSVLNRLYAVHTYINTYIPYIIARDDFNCPSTLSLSSSAIYSNQAIKISVLGGSGHSLNNAGTYLVCPSVTETFWPSSTPGQGRRCGLSPRRTDNSWVCLVDGGLLIPPARLAPSTMGCGERPDWHGRTAVCFKPQCGLSDFSAMDPQRQRASIFLNSCISKLQDLAGRSNQSLLFITQKCDSLS